MKTVSNTPHDRFITVKEAAHLTGFGTSTVWAKLKNNLFPKPIRISTGMTRWRLSDIQRFMEDPQAWVENNAEGK